MNSEKVGEELKIAKSLLPVGFMLLEKGFPFDAAKKIWDAVRLATRALTLTYLGRNEPAKGRTWRDFVKTALLEAGLNEAEASSWADYFITARASLLGECFLAHIYEEEEHKSIMQKAKEYVVLIEKLVSNSRTS